MAGAGAFGERPPAVPARHRADDEEAEAAALGADGDAGRNAVEAAEDPFQLRRRNADAVDRSRERRTRWSSSSSSATRIADVAGEYLTALSIRFQTAAFSSSPSPSTIGSDAGALDEVERLGPEVEARARQLDAFARDLREVQPDARRCAADASPCAPARST